MKLSRLTALVLTLVMAVILFAGCGTTEQAATASGDAAAAIASEASAKPAVETSAEPVTVNMFIQKNAVDAWGTKLKDQFEAANPNIKVEWNLLAEDSVQAFQKMDMAVMSGDPTDVVLLQNPNHYSKYVSGKLLAPLNDLAAEAGYDINKIYGGYAKKYENDTYYWLPDSVTMNIVYYNKKIFDDAGVPYPTGKWTWDEYIETAKKLTDTSKGIYGSFMMLDWEYFNYMLANQKKTPAYKEDGTSNFDDPAWGESLKFLHDLAAVHKIQPSRPEFAAKKLQFDSFMSGKFAMQVLGTWFLGTAQDYEKYPRDWKIGVCAPPANPGGENILSAGGGFGLSKTATHPKEAFKFITYLCENEYTANGGVTPARVDISKEDMLKVFENTSKSLKGEVTAQELMDAAYPPNLGVANEKIIGTASAQINDTWNKEAEKYMFDQQSLEDTMKNIKTKADDFIAEAKASAK